MSKASDLIHTSQLDVEIQDGLVVQTLRKRGSLRVKETWRREKKLAAGGFGIVYLEQCIAEEHRVRAVKQLAKSRSIDYSRELEAAALFSQKRYEGSFVESFGWYDSPDFVFLTMEYLPLGDLQRYMDSRFPEAEARLVIAQVLEGLNFMHERNFTHRDLKPANILVSQKGPNWWVKLTDFGISKRAIEGVSGLHTQIFTPQFVAPEILFVSEHYTSAVDIWSTGIVAFMLMTGTTAIFRTTPDLLRYWQSSEGLPLQKLVNCRISNEGQDFVVSLLASKPDSRPSAAACLEHVWLDTVSDSIPMDVVPEQKAMELSIRTTESAQMPTASAQWTTTSDQGSLNKDQTSILSKEDSVILSSPVPKRVPVRATSSKSTSELHESPQKSSIGKGPAILPFEPRTIKCPWPVACISFSADSTTLAILGVDGTEVCFYDSRSLQPKFNSIRMSDRIHQIVFAPVGTVIAARCNREVWIKDVGSTFSGVAIRTPASLHYCDFFFSPNGSRVALGDRQQGTCSIYDTADGTVLMTVKVQVTGKGYLAFLPDGNRFVTVSRRYTLRILDIETHKTVAEIDSRGFLSATGPSKSWNLFKPALHSILGVTCSSTGMLAAFTNSTVQLWNKDLVLVFTIHEYASHAVFSLDGTVLAVLHAARIVLWHVSRNRPQVIRHVALSQPPPYNIEQAMRLWVSCDGHLIAAVWNNGVTIWRIDTGEEVFRSDYHLHPWANQFAFSPDGEAVAIQPDGDGHKLVDIATLKSKHSW